MSIRNSAPTSHSLKSWPSHFRALLSGAKTFEIRFNDRGYQVGDRLILKEFTPEFITNAGDRELAAHPPGTYTGNHTERWVTHIDGESRGVAKGFVMLALREQRGASGGILGPGAFSGAAICEALSTQKPLPIPPDVYWNPTTQNFYSTITGRGCGEEFCGRWSYRSAEFPTKFEMLHGKRANELLTAHERELLVITSEEFFEAGLQISKLLRFGRVGIDKSVMPNRRYDNITLLGFELGHVQHMINVLQACELVPPSCIKSGDKEKGEKLQTYLQNRPNVEGQG